MNPRRRDAAIFCGSEVSRLGIELAELAPDLCDTAARFDLVALAEVQP